MSGARLVGFDGGTSHGFEAGAPWCWRRSACEPAEFDYGTKYSVFMKAQGYSKYTDFNCYAGHGGDDIDTDKTAPGGLSRQECEARCDADPKCSCVTQSAVDAKCWKRANCVPADCVKKTIGFDVYVNNARRPPSPTPLPPTPV